MVAAKLLTVMVAGPPVKASVPNWNTGERKDEMVSYLGGLPGERPRAKARGDLPIRYCLLAG